MDRVIYMNEFNYYLDAWLYCRVNKLDHTKVIRKKDFKTWIVAL